MARSASGEPVGQAQQRVGVRAHRPADVDEQHHPARTGAAPAPRDLTGLTEVTQ
jgi:hypothetical protein